VKRADVLEAMAEEISQRPTDKLASFQTWDDGRRRLDGMSKGRRWDIDREQRDWERKNKAELAKYEARFRWSKHEKAHPDRCAAALAKWVRENRDHLRAYRAKYAKDHPEQERQWGKNKRAKVKADPTRHARSVARYARYREKLKTSDPAKWAAKLKANRERKAQTRVRKHTRHCGACGATGHNRRSCWRSQ
jgi:hypothetical protein